MRGYRLLPLAILLPGLLTGGVSIHVLDGRPVVDGVYVSGHGPYRFLLDTGTTMNHLEPSVAREAGLEPTFRTELRSSTGTAMLPGRGGLVVEVAGIRAEGQEFLFGGFDAVHQLSSGIQGVLGQPILSRFNYLIDLKAKRLVFNPPETSGNRTSFQALEGRTVVATNLGNLVLDSGAARLVLFGVESLIDGKNLIRTMAGSQFVGVVSRRLTIEGRHIWKGEAVALDKKEQPGVAGLMPLSFFHSVYVCNSERYLVLE